MTITITFHPDGTATCLHNDIIPLQEFGHLTVRRASRVEFAEAIQRWQVFSAKDSEDGNPPIFENESREACLEWERENFDKLL